MIRNTKMVIALLTAILFVALASPAMAQSWGQTGAGEPPTMEDLIPRMSSGQAYTERYSFAVDFDDGGHVGANFTISNLGVRSGYGAAEIRVRHPDHDNYSHQERVSRGDWSYDEDTFGLDIAGAQLEADGDDAFKLTYQGDDAAVDLRFQTHMEMWRPGRGEIRRDDDYYRFTLVAPRSDVTGRIKIDGQWHDVQGTRRGYADHVATNVAPFDLGKRFTRFRTYEDDVFVLWREIRLTRDFGGRSVSWIVVGVDDEIIYEDPDAEVQYGNLERDEETSYQVPHAVQVVSQKGDHRMRFLLRGDEVDRRDLLASYGRVVRAIASRFSEPYEYTIRGDYILEVNADQPVRIRDSSHFIVDHVNP